MAETSDSKRLDVLFRITRETVLLKMLPLILTAIEQRLSVLDGREASYKEATEELTNFAITRIDQVLKPAYDYLGGVMAQGFDSSKISDARLYGRRILATDTRNDLVSLLGLRTADITGAVDTDRLTRAIEELNRNLGQVIEQNRSDAAEKITALQAFARGYDTNLFNDGGQIVGYQKLGGKMMIQYGTFVGTSNDVGDARIVFPVSFRERPIVFPVNGDWWLNRLKLIIYQGDRILPSNFTVTTFNEENAILVANRTFRCNYVAFGSY